MRGPPLPDDETLRALAGRLGPERLTERLRRERAVWTAKTGPIPWYLQPFGGKDAFVRSMLAAVGLWSAAHREFLDVRIVRNTLRLPRLPKGFDGFRIIQLSDLHINIDPDLAGVVLERLQDIAWDAAVLTGDFHNNIGMPHDLSTPDIRRVVTALGRPVFAILGNHDVIRRVGDLEAMGVTVLLNEHAAISRGSDTLWVCGVDDPRYFRTHDLVAARAGVPPGAPAILLAHSPQVWREAAALDYDSLLAGHTHGGQLCLPGGFPLYRNAPVPRRLLAGAWTEGRMQGYTSRGTGACGVAARLCCPPEITLHTLQRTD